MMAATCSPIRWISVPHHSGSCLLLYKVDLCPSLWWQLSAPPCGGSLSLIYNGSCLLPYAVDLPYYGGSCLLPYAVDLFHHYGGSCLLPHAVDLFSYYDGSCLLPYEVDLSLSPMMAAVCSLMRWISLFYLWWQLLLLYKVYLIVSVVAVSAPIGYLLLFPSISPIEPKNKAVECLNVKRNIFRAKKPLISWAGGREKDLERERSRKVEEGRERP
jgi:hypothetical protein